MRKDRVGADYVVVVVPWLLGKRRCRGSIYKVPDPSWNIYVGVAYGGSWLMPVTTKLGC